ncbi:hypothetical protein C8F04DRAFT_1275118 [Mycena alexandri]|uniref:Uncharacterized protein n=1 Tax=Mycena alexandri TaxID=1745969 RepID=A0AAD6S379_9AGAR|nr:hypothetical protein C8F04DRAFT_1275118 [Mycena alexandri]
MCAPTDLDANGLTATGTSTSPEGDVRVDCTYSSGDCAYIDGDHFDLTTTNTACPKTVLIVSSTERRGRSSSSTRTSHPGVSANSASASRTLATPSSSSTTSQFSTSGISTHSVSASGSPSPSVVTPIHSNRHITRAAAIAGTVAAVVLFAGVVFSLLWCRKRRERMARTLPDQFLAQQAILQENAVLTGKSQGATATSNEPQVSVRRENELVSDRAPAEDVPHQETLTLRMHRVEAQLAALLTMGPPEGSPPSYSG